MLCYRVVVQYHDMKLVFCDGERWVHSLLLSSMSPFLRTLLQTSPGRRPS